MRLTTKVGIGLACAVALAWCGWASAFHRTTGAAWAAWLASLTAVVLADIGLWQSGRGRWPHWKLSPARVGWPSEGSGTAAVLRGMAPWLLLASVVLIWEVLGIDTGPEEPHLTISALSQAYRALDAATLAVWMAVGVGYGLARARKPTAAPPDDDDPATTGPATMGPATTGPAAAMAVGVVGHRILTGHGSSLSLSLTLSLSGPSAPPALPTLPALLLGHSRLLGVSFWLAVVLAAGLIDALGRRPGGRVAPAGDLVRLLSRRPWANVVLIAAWSLAGLHLFAY